MCDVHGDSMLKADIHPGTICVRFTPFTEEELTCYLQKCNKVLPDGVTESDLMKCTSGILGILNHVLNNASDLTKETIEQLASERIYKIS